jgi:GNAT superfamily N-acetyltransferase
MIAVRTAEPADVPAMSAILIASITELCGADHKDDPSAIARWTANKTPEGVAKMLANPSNDIFLAECDGRPAAVGCINGSVEIGLNYVHPGHRFRGVSKALLTAMEDVLRRRGVAEGHLSSTGTAHRFYLSCGWTDAGPTRLDFGLTCQPMRKAF